MAGIIGLGEAIRSIQVAAWSPAMASRDLYNTLSNTQMAGNFIPDNLAMAKKYFPSVNALGLGNILTMDSETIFPFKDNQLALTDSEVPTTIIVMNKASSEIQYQTNKFILQSISKPNQERFQIIETFGDPSLFFYGPRTPVYTIQGLLLDGEDPAYVDMDTPATAADERKKGKYYWATAFQDLYTRYMRGTMLKQNGQIAALYINNWFIKGYPVHLVINKDSGTIPQAVSFQMTWVIEKESLLREREAGWLYKNNKIGKLSASALNEYLVAMQAYTKAYDNWKIAGTAAVNTTELSREKDSAMRKQAEALKNLRAALDKESRAISR